jgi:tetratricopeptide (TPR) repeat protein
MRRTARVGRQIRGMGVIQQVGRQWLCRIGSPHRILGIAQQLGYARSTMGLFDKLRRTKKPATETGHPCKEPILIQVFDKSGTPLYLTKEEWRTKVLPGMLSARWANPDELYTVIVGTLQDGLPADVAEAAEQLYRIDPNRSRAVCVWANVLLGMNQIDKAEHVLNSHIEQYGEEGYVVTNLAKVHAARNQNDRAAAILWHALELDPNQKMAVGWFVALANQRSGKSAMVEAWERVAALPGSWHAQLWLARAALESHNTPRALACYRESLARVGESVPVEFLQQMSGDLGIHGRFTEVVELTEPYFIPELHGLQVANNLIKANIELGHLQRARQILNQLRTQPRPDWRAHLDHWDTEIDLKSG